jgi:hypothetical protein
VLSGTESGTLTVITRYYPEALDDYLTSGNVDYTGRVPGIIRQIVNILMLHHGACPVLKFRLGDNRVLLDRYWERQLEDSGWIAKSGYMFVSNIVEL